MDLLKRAKILMNVKAMGPSVAVLVIAIAFAVGTYAKEHSKKPDQPLEQAAELVLEMVGIDHDFTPESEE
jgi:hypothetical protein